MLFSGTVCSGIVVLFQGSSSNLVQIILSWKELPFVLAAQIPPCHTFLFSYFLICLQGASIASSGCKIGITDLFIQFHAFALACDFQIFKPAVITASGDFQYFAHHLDRPLFRLVFLYKEIDQRFFLEMMLKAFFNMSRSVSASTRRFSSSAIFFGTLHLMTGLHVRGNWLPLSAGILSSNDIKERGQYPILVQARKYSCVQN